EIIQQIGNEEVETRLNQAIETELSVNLGQGN
ncbi:MAG: hypothetical protein RJA26_1067, partial [Actinomycetota bacterium]